MSTQQTAERIEDFEFLMSVGEDPIRAVERVGWPSPSAADSALRRAGHVVPTALHEAAKNQPKRAA